MDKKELIVDIVELKSFINDNFIEVPILMTPYNHKVIIAEDLLVKIQQLSNLTVEEFQEYLNGIKGFSKYDRNELIDRCVENIEFPGMFKLHGYEKVGNRAFIYVHKIFDKK